MEDRRKLLIGATGSVGVISLPHYLLAIKNRCADAEIKVLLSPTAQTFVQPNVIALFNEAILDSLEADWAADTNHIQLARWADAMAVLPASADILARAAHGQANSLLSLTMLAFEGSIRFFPNMNRSMWTNPATQRNVGLLREFGHVVVDPPQEPSYEVSTGEFEVGPVMPGPKAVAAMLHDVLYPADSES